MHRIDAPGFAVGNLFTEGNPTLGIPATEVSDDWLNDVQEELTTVIEGQGIALVKGLQTQLQSAILSMIGDGGTQTIQVIANNTGPADVTVLIFDKANFKAAKITFDLERRTATQNLQEIGELYVSHDTNDDLWRIAVSSNLDDAKVVFTVTAAGQVQFTSDDLTGANYVGEMRITSVISIKQ